MIQREFQITQRLDFVIQHTVGDWQKVGRVGENNGGFSPLLGDGFFEHCLRLGHDPVGAANGARCDIFRHVFLPPYFPAVP